jgi:hypothetical protein
MIPHPIRLRHPWETEGSAAGNVTYRRKFNRPTGLDLWEQVTLEIDRAVVAGQVSLNGTSLGQLKPGEFFTADISSLLAPANELCVLADPRSALAAPPGSSSIYITDPDEPLGSPVGDVRLVIRSTPTL